MHEVAYVNYDYKVGEGEWHRIDRQIAFLDPSEWKDKITVCRSFNDLLDVAEDKSFPNVFCTETFFRHRPKVFILTQYQSLSGTPRIWRDVKEDIIFQTSITVFKPTMEWLLKNLEVEQFFQYLDERGIVYNPVFEKGR